MEIQLPEYRVDVVETRWAPWEPVFKRSHYLSDAGPMAFSTGYCGFIGDEPVCFLGMSAMSVGKGVREARACRFVTRAEWQGAGIGIPFLEFLCERELRGEGFVGFPSTVILHTAHPALCHVLLRSPKWRKISAALHGGGQRGTKDIGYGMHMRAMAGFRYGGQRYADAFNKEKTA